MAASSPIGTEGRRSPRRETFSLMRLNSQHSSPQSRSRASTFQDGMADDTMGSKSKASTSDNNQGFDQDDIFEQKNLVSCVQGLVQDLHELDTAQEVPAGFDELPIELVSLIDRFLESLSAKVHSDPPSIDKLSHIFQDFYVKAEAHTTTHINALSTRQSWGSSNPSVSSKGSHAAGNGNRLRSSSSRDTLGSVTSGSEQQMLTPKEISDRRKARRLLHCKRVALEEAVEKKVCEAVYQRIWRHRSTLDEVRDEKLRSRTAALALVGISLKDLGIDFDISPSVRDGPRVEDWLSRARDGLLRMNDAQCPLGKLQQLATAHKSIVDLLTEYHQSSSSADEILPTLIYILITSPPEGINVISNLHFIQRFRASNRVDGEAAYCLVNLEAAITFLETVDLASLRSDEPIQRPLSSNSSRPTTPLGEDYPSPPQSTQDPNSGISLPNTTPGSSQRPLFKNTSLSPSPPAPSRSSSPSHERGLSNLFQPPTSAFGAAGDAVRTTADQSIKTISSTLDSSFNLIFGRLKEHNVKSDGIDTDGAITVPKTLEDARKLVEPRSEEDDECLTSAVSSTVRMDAHSESNGTKSEDIILSAVAGRKQQARDRSVDSAQSSGSGKRKVAFAPSAAKKNSPSNQSPPSHSGNAAVESMLSFGNTLNPLKSFSSFRGFGKTTPSISSGGLNAGAPRPTSAVNLPTTAPPSSIPEKKLETSEDQHGNASATLTIEPPIQRFVEAGDVEDLKIGDVAELLRDYKRLALAMKRLDAGWK